MNESAEFNESDGLELAELAIFAHSFPSSKFWHAQLELLYYGRSFFNCWGAFTYIWNAFSPYDFSLFTSKLAKRFGIADYIHI
jgi:hypothetical protein